MARVVSQAGLQGVDTMALTDEKTTKLTPASVWAECDRSSREAAARCLYSPEWDSGTGKREADRAIAGAIRFRESAVRQLPVERRVDYLLRAVQPDESLAYSLLMALHLVDRRAMLGAFLDSLDIPHENGLVPDSYEPSVPEDTRLATAVDRLLGAFPREEVRLYLLCLQAMDPQTWSGLARLTPTA